ncbi:MAG: hypothetical protein EOO43_18380 [Flavobacterium sp.]|nr:MAG: hypothetical protein EOO43_18380 [Flavobacterium sp.]
MDGDVGMVVALTMLFRLPLLWGEFIPDSARKLAAGAFAFVYSLPLGFNHEHHVDFGRLKNQQIKKLVKITRTMYKQREK